MNLNGSKRDEMSSTRSETVNKRNDEMNAQNKPVFEAKLRQIRASVFKNEDKEGNAAPMTDY